MPVPQSTDTPRPDRLPAPYFADERVTLYHGDSLSILCGVPDGSVDAVEAVRGSGEDGGLFDLLEEGA